MRYRGRCSSEERLRLAWTLGCCLHDIFSMIKCGGNVFIKFSFWIAMFAAQIIFIKHNFFRFCTFIKCMSAVVLLSTVIFHKEAAKVRLVFPPWSEAAASRLKKSCHILPPPWLFSENNTVRFFGCFFFCSVWTCRCDWLSDSSAHLFVDYDSLAAVLWLPSISSISSTSGLPPFISATQSTYMRNLRQEPNLKPRTLSLHLTFSRAQASPTSSGAADTCTVLLNCSRTCHVALCTGHTWDFLIIERACVNNRACWNGKL